MGPRHAGLEIILTNLYCPPALEKDIRAGQMSMPYIHSFKISQSRCNLGTSVLPPLKASPTYLADERSYRGFGERRVGNTSKV